MTTSTHHDSVVSELVRGAPIPLLLIDLASRTIVEASDPVLSLMRQQRDRVVGHLVAAHSADASATGMLLDLVATGDVDGYQTTRKLRRGDGEVIEVTVWTRAVAHGGERRYLLSQLAPVPTRDTEPAQTIDGPAVIGIIDADWKVVTVSDDIEGLVGIPAANLIGQGTFEGVHPSDHADLLLAAANMLAEQRGVTVRLRVRHGDGRWIRIRAHISLMTAAHGRQYAFAMSPTPERVVDAAPLEEHLRRIALEVRAAGIGRIFDDEEMDAHRHAIDGLTTRQWEVLTRLLQGARVASIARELYISQSTVRNHLAAIFERTGVSSQVELIEKLGRARKDGSPSAA